MVYARRLGAESVSWISSHPTDFASLYIKHVLEVLFPQDWQFSLFGGGAAQSSIRSFLCAVLSVGSLASTGAAVLRRELRWLYPVLFLLIPTLIYGVFQPVPRYTYLIYGISALMAADGYARLFRCARTRLISSGRIRAKVIASRLQIGK